jgi:hypothetical protein
MSTANCGYESQGIPQFSLRYKRLEFCCLNETDVRTENLNSGVVVMESAKDGV